MTWPLDQAHWDASSITGAVSATHPEGATGGSAPALMGQHSGADGRSAHRRSGPPSRGHRGNRRPRQPTDPAPHPARRHPRDLVTARKRNSTTSASPKSKASLRHGGSIAYAPDLPGRHDPHLPATRWSGSRVTQARHPRASGRRRAQSGVPYCSLRPQPAARASATRAIGCPERPLPLRLLSRHRRRR
jgi:hypothetical protein